MIYKKDDVILEIDDVSNFSNFERGDRMERLQSTSNESVLILHGTFDYHALGRRFHRFISDSHCSHFS